MQQVLRERDAVKADRNRLLARVSQLERDVSKLEVTERQKAAAVSADVLTVFALHGRVLNSIGLVLRDSVMSHSSHGIFQHMSQLQHVLLISTCK